MSELTKNGNFMIDLLPAQEDEGNSFHVDFSAVPADADNYGLRFKGEVEASFDYAYMSGKLILKGKAKAVTIQQCDRCLTEVDVKTNLDFNEVLYKESGSEDEDEVYTYTGEKIYLDKMILEGIVLGLPTKILCKEDCKGLCPICGTDLNKTSCDCKNEEIDESNPFSKLAGLFKDDEEV